MATTKPPSVALGSGDGPFMETMAAVVVVPLSVALRVGIRRRLPWFVDMAVLVVPFACVVTETLPALGTAAGLLVCAVGLRPSEADAEAAVRLFRSATALATGVSILAVDFAACFPDRYKKTHDVGLSLMDLGTAATAFGDGLRRRQSSKSQRKKVPWALLALGAGRTLFVKATGYPEPEAEYRHGWNFFWTLACVAVVEKQSSPLVLLLVALVFVVAAPADPPWAPGVETVPCYVALHSAAKTFLEAHGGADRRRGLYFSVLAFAFLLRAGYHPVSRAKGNLGYVLVSFAISVLIFELLLLLAAPSKTTPSSGGLLHSLQRPGNLLAYFLAANLLVGAAKSLVDPTTVERKSAVVALLFAHSALAAAAVAAYQEKLPLLRRRLVGRHKKEVEVELQSNHHK